jgi:hypothetical protein
MAEAKHTPGRHSVKAAYIGPLFRRPDAYEVEVSVEPRRSRWAVRTDCNGFTTYRGGFASRRAAVEAADKWAAETTRRNEEVRAAKASA